MTDSYLSPCFQMPPVSFQGTYKNSNSVPHLFLFIVSSIKTLGCTCLSKEPYGASTCYDLKCQSTVSGNCIPGYSLMECGFHAGLLPRRNGQMPTWKYFTRSNILCVFKGAQETLRVGQVPQEPSSATFRESGTVTSSAIWVLASWRNDEGEL